MSEIVFGPYFTRAAPSQNFPGFKPLGVNLEFASSSHSVAAPVFEIERESYRFGLADYYIPAQQISWRIVYRPYFSREIDGVLLLPLDDVFFSLYRTFPKVQPLLSVLAEMRGFLASVEPLPRGRFLPRELLEPSVVAAGVRLTDVFAFGRSLSVAFQWIPPQDADRLASPLAMSVGAAEFLGQRDGTLNKGKWRKARVEHIGDVGRKELAKLFRLAPASLLSEQGRKYVLEQFKWHPVHLMSAKELKEARLHFIKEHPDLWSDHKALAKALQEAQLYQKTTDLSHIRRSLPKLLLEVGPAGADCGEAQS